MSAGKVADAVFCKRFKKSVLSESHPLQIKGWLLPKELVVSYFQITQRQYHASSWNLRIGCLAAVVSSGRVIGAL